MSEKLPPNPKGRTVSVELCPYGMSGDTCLPLMEDKPCICALTDERDAYRSDWLTAEMNVARLRARVAELEGALAFYADPENWVVQDASSLNWFRAGPGQLSRRDARIGRFTSGRGMVRPAFINDYGETARAALAKKEGA